MAARSSRRSSRRPAEPARQPGRHDPAARRGGPAGPGRTLPPRRSAGLRHVTAAVGLEHPLGRRGMPRQPVGGADRAPDELAPAVRAAAPKPFLGARSTERALERADHRVRGVTGEIAIAAFTTGAELKHGASLSRAAAPLELESLEPGRRLALLRSENHVPGAEESDSACASTGLGGQCSPRDRGPSAASHRKFLSSRSGPPRPRGSAGVSASRGWPRDESSWRRRRPAPAPRRGRRRRGGGRPGREGRA